MVIVNLKGGLGNQMFQYATGRRLALHHNTVLKLDLSSLECCPADITPRKFVLNHFNINAEVATKQDLDCISKHGYSFKKFCNKVSRGKTKPNPPIKVFLEKHFHFDPTVLRLPDNSYLEGYWQSQKYFEDIEEVIREDFRLKHALSGQNIELARIIESQNSVSVHIRRGDYIYSPNVSAYYGVCSLDYYQSAVTKIALQQPGCQFIVFSDDIDWVKKHLVLSYPMIVIENNGPEMAYEDLRLMSLCKHHIIANSSFGWWGAWLSLFSGKTVIAPKRWFNNPSINTNDLIPSCWIRV
jgi:hypothetical protein